MSGTQLNNVAMDLDGFLRTYGACEKTAWAFHTCGPIPLRELTVRENIYGVMPNRSTGAPQNNKEEAFTSARARPCQLFSHNEIMMCRSRRTCNGVRVSKWGKRKL
jgi:hypothetical protein